MTQDTDPARVRAKYAELGMSGMVELIDHLEEMKKLGREIREIGSGTIVPPGWTEKENMTEAEIFHAVFFEFKSLYFGGKDRTPLQDIDAAFEKFKNAPEKARAWIDGVFQSLARANARIFGGDYDIIDFDEDDNEIIVERGKPWVQ